VVCALACSELPFPVLLSLSVSLSVCLSVCLSSSLCLSVCLSSLSVLSLCLSVLSLCPLSLSSLFLSLCLSVLSLSLCLSVLSLSLCLTVLSLCLCLWEDKCEHISKYLNRVSSGLTSALFRRIMEKLKAEIARKKAEADRLKQAANGGTSMSSFIRQKDVLNAKQQKLEEDCRKIEEVKASKKRDNEEAPVVTSSVSAGGSIFPRDGLIQLGKRPKIAQTDDGHQKPLSSCPSSSMQEEVSPGSLPRFQRLFTSAVVDVKQRLRLNRQPVTLFAESDNDRVERLIRILLEVEQHRKEDDGRDYRQVQLSDERDERDLEDSDRAESSSSAAAASMLTQSATPSHVLPSTSSTGQIASVEHYIDVGDGHGDDHDSNLRFDPNRRFSEMTDLAAEQIVYKFFRSVLKQWEYDLSIRSDMEKVQIFV
jgi:hypothetical protein